MDVWFDQNYQKFIHVVHAGDGGKKSMLKKSFELSSFSTKFE